MDRVTGRAAPRERGVDRRYWLRRIAPLIRFTATIRTDPGTILPFIRGGTLALEALMPVP
jgi:hypothetical protein